MTRAGRLAPRNLRKTAGDANLDFRADNAHELGTIDDESVDHALGDDVLYHLDLARLALVLTQKFAPDGYVRFIEPAQVRVLLHAFHMRTPKPRTVDENPFDRESIALLEKHVQVSIGYHGLLRPLAPMLFFNSKAFNSKAVTEVARRWDDVLLRHPLLQPQAWLLQIELRRR